MDASGRPTVAEDLRRELRSRADPAHAAGAARYFGPDFRCYGIRGGKAVIRRLVTAALRESAGGDSWELVSNLAEELLASRIYEEGQAAIVALQTVRRRWPDGALATFERWLRHHIDNWGICDSFCIAVTAPFLSRHLEERGVVHRWAADPRLWLRRAGWVTLAKLCRPLGPTAVPEVERMVRGLVRSGENEDLVHKAAGWLLKECSVEVGVPFVEALVRQHGAALPRVTVRIATERMAPADRDRIRARHRLAVVPVAARR